MLDCISIKSVANFDETGIHLDNLKKINFIYGVNASGKTTISNLIANPTNSDFEYSHIDWNHNQTLKALVYNKNFRDSNFGGSSKLKGVFTLGEATKEDIDIIEQKKQELTELREKIKC